MKSFVYTNKRGETVVAYELFRNLKPEKIKGLPAKMHRRRRDRRTANGTLNPDGTKRT